MSAFIPESFSPLLLLFLVLYLVLFRMLLKFAYPLAVFIHEVGHLTGVLLLTRLPVTLFIGKRSHAQHHRFNNRVSFAFSLEDAHLGFCQYEQAAINSSLRILIALGGPLFSLCGLLLALWALLNFSPLYHPIAMLGLLFGYANLKLLVTSLLPITYAHRGEAMLSDGLFIWHELTRRHR